MREQSSRKSSHKRTWGRIILSVCNVYHVSGTVAVVLALASEVVEADADAAELLVLGAVVSVHLALLPLQDSDKLYSGWSN